MAERWRTIPINVLYVYSVSSLGRVRQDTAGPRTKAGRVVHPHPIRGYPSVSLRGDTKCSRYVHLLVLLTFRGPCPDGMEGLHYNDDPSDAGLRNLRYGTHIQNYEDARRNGIKLGSAARSRETNSRLSKVRWSRFSAKRRSEIAYKSIATSKARGRLLGLAALSIKERKNILKKAWRTRHRNMRRNGNAA